MKKLIGWLLPADEIGVIGYSLLAIAELVEYVAPTLV